MKSIILSALFILSFARNGNGNSLPNKFDLKVSLSEKLDKVVQSTGQPADTSVLGQLSDLASRLDRLEESDRARGEELTQRLDKMDKKLDGQMEQRGQPVMAGNSDSSSQVLDVSMQLNVQKVDKRLEKCEERTDALEAFKTKGQEQLAALATSANSIEENSKKIEGIIGQLETIQELQTKNKYQLPTSAYRSGGLSGPLAGSIAFNCYQNSSRTAGVMTYTACDVDTTEGGMDPNSGKFTAKKSGLYRFYIQGDIEPQHMGQLWMKKGSTTITFAQNRKGSWPHWRPVNAAVMTKMETGEQVFVEVHGEFFSNSDRHTLFQGYFLAP